MDDDTAIISLIATCNLSIIKKLYSYAPDETSESINSAMATYEQNPFTCKIMINWMLDNIQLSSKILNLMFDIMIITYRKPGTEISNRLITKLITIGATTSNSEFIFLSDDHFFDYVSQNEYQINTESVKYIFHNGVDKKIQNYLYNLLVRTDLHIDVIYIILLNTFCYENKYDDKVDELIGIASKSIFFKELIYSLVCDRHCNEITDYVAHNHIITEYISSYDFCDDMIFLQKIVYVRYILDKSWYPVENLKNMVSCIKSSKDITKLCESICVTSTLPSKMIYEEIIKNLITLKNIVQE